MRTEAIDAVPAAGDEEPADLDEDDPGFVLDTHTGTGSHTTETPGGSANGDEPAGNGQEDKTPKKKLGKRCWFAA